MKSVKTQIVYNLKKDKGSYFSFGIILLFTAFMINLAFVLLFQIDKVYDLKSKALHTADIDICIPKEQDQEELIDEIRAIQGVKEVESKEAIFAEALIKDFRDTDFSTNTVFYNMDDFRNINKLDIKEENLEESERSIYIPLYVASFGEFELGNEIIYEMNGIDYTFFVSGILEEMQYGNFGKGIMGAYLPTNVYQKLKQNHENNIVTEYSIITDTKSELKEVQNKVSNLFMNQNIEMLSNSDNASTKETRTMVCNLIILILLAFAFVIMLVSVFLCMFRIRNSIEEEMVNMGVLKAVGYTGSMIIKSIVFPYLIVTVIATFIGIIVSYSILPILSQVLTLQSGFSFALSFDIKSLICVEVILVCIVMMIAYSTAKRIKKIQPINAITGNGEEKDIKKNYFPLEETVGNTQLLLILKQIIVCGKQNVLLFLVSFVLTILVAFASTLFYNVIIKPNNFSSTLSDEVPDVIFYPKEECKDLLIDKLEAELKVKNVLQYSIGTVKIKAISVTAFICENFEEVTNNLCYLGENPKTKDEIALGSAFEETYNLGDTIEIDNGGFSCFYKITGFIQSVNNLGNICEFTVEGYERLTTQNIAPSLYVYLEEDVNAEFFIKDVEKNYSDMIVKSINSQKMTEISQKIYSGITTVIIIAIFTLTMMIVLFILYIVIRSLLVRRKQELGIYKALGYSNWQLIMQMAGSFLPVSILAVLLSSLLGMYYLPLINQIIFQSVGAMKNNMELSFLFLMIFAFLQVSLNFIISISLSMPIKKISAYTLIKD